MEQAKNWKWSQFGELCNCQDLEDYLTGREYTHSNYFHYTKLDVVDSILKNRKFWLSNVEGFNDTIDTKQFGKAPVPIFSLCFSTGINENLPLWYLYSGVDGKGARIGLTKTNVEKLINDGKYSLHLFNADEGKDGEELMPLKKGENMELIFRDVIYTQIRDGKSNYELKYNTMTNYRMPKKEFDKYQQNHNGFQKGLIWYYEKETRLLVRLTGDAEKKWKEKISSKGNTLRVFLSFDESLLKKMKITVAPNITSQDMDELLKTKKGIYEFLKKTAAVQESQYVGTINMRLCDHCSFKKNR